MRKLQRILFLIINSLFVAKYSIRFGYNPFVITCLYCLFAEFTFWALSKKNNLRIKETKRAYFSLMILIFVAILLLNNFVDPLKLQVDRWSAIHNFIQNLFKGIYPYSAHTHLGGYASPFPVWQIFHIPFYLLGNVGLGMLFSAILLSVFLVWFFENYHFAFYFIVLIVISPAFWYEVAVRSDLIYNFIFCLMAIAFAHKQKYTIQNQTFRLGILCGLFLSTRISVIIPFAIFLYSDFIRSSFKQKLIFISVSFFVFAISFLPFIIWNFNMLFFSKFNPFLLQTRQGSLIEMILIIGLAIYFSIKWKGNFSLYSAYTSITLVTLVIISFLHRMISDNFVNGLFDSAFDLTYFTMALPFIIFALTNTDIEELKN